MTALLLAAARVWALVLCLALSAPAAAGVIPFALRLGDAPVAPADVSGLPTGGARFAGSGLSVDTSDRAAVATLYHLYKAANLVPSDWVGDVFNCQAGSTGANYKQATLQQINFFRAMAGVPADISFDATFSAKAQQAALMMSANDQLDHHPPSSWKCYSDDGYTAAGDSNLALGTAGPYAIKGYMDDTGPNNAAVGHRRWLLYPQTQLMGTGDVTNAANGGADTNALWVIDGNYNGPRPLVRDGFVAWPPKGYVPYDLVPARWSLSYPNADFSAASVTVTSNGANLPVQIEPASSEIVGENTLVWVVNGRDTSTATVLAKPQNDTAYQVTVSGVGGGAPNSFAYTVIVFDADPTSPGMAFVPAQPNLTVGRSVTVDVTGVAGSLTRVNTSSNSSSLPVEVAFASSTSLKLTGKSTGTEKITVTDASGATATLSASVAAQTSTSDWQIDGRADGTPDAMTLVADVLPASGDDQAPGAYFVGALLPDGVLYLNDGQNWVPYTPGGDIPAYSTGTLAQRSFPVFVALDTQGLSGTQVLVGYGRSAADMVNNGKFRTIYTVH